MATDGTRPSLGTRIRRAREAAELTQEELARRVHRSLRAVNDWENDRTSPRNSLGALERVLGVSLDGYDSGSMPLISDELRAQINREYPPAVAREVLGAIEGTLTGEVPNGGRAAGPRPA